MKTSPSWPTGRVRRSVVELLRSCLAPLFLACPAVALASPLARVLESDAEHAVVEIAPGALATETVEAEGRRYVRFRVRDLGLTDETGTPELPVGSLSLAVPPGTRPVLNVISAWWSEPKPGAVVPVPERVGVRGGPLEPSQVVEREPREERAYLEHTQWPEQPFRLSPVRGLRHQRVVAVEYHAAMAEVFTRTYRVLENARLEVRFVPDRASRALESLRPAPRSELWERTNKAVLANSGDARTWGRGGLGDGPSVGDAPYGSGDQWRVRFAETGIREIPFENLQAAGFPSGVAVTQLDVYQRSFDLAAVDDPGTVATDLFLTLPVPVEIRDRDGNGTFGPGDGIVFWARSVRDQWMTSGFENEDLFDATNCVWIRLAAGGARMVLDRPAGSLSGTAADSLVSTPSDVFREEDRRYTIYPMDFGPDRGGFETDFYYFNDHRVTYDLPAPHTIPDTFDIVDLVPGTTGTLLTRTVGTGKPNFQFFTNVLDFALNGTSVGSRQFYNANWYTNTGGAAEPESTFASYSIPAGRLVNGTNDFLLTARTYSGNGTSSPYNVVRFLFDWYRVTYSRALIARSEECRLRTDQGTAGNNLIRVRDFGGSDLLLFDVTDPAAPARVGVAPAQIVAAGGGRFDLRFDHDNAGGNGEYVALRDGSIPEIPSADIALRSTPSLLGGGTGAVYVALAHDSLLEGARDLANWRAERFPSLAVAESEVWDVFHNGRRDPEAIKAFAAYALHRWATPIEFLCLVGDANEDHRNLGSVAMPDLVPSHSLWAAYEGAPEESDQYYAELTRDSEGRWDDLSDIYVGRLAVNDLEELAWNLQRMQAYEAGTGTSQQWRRRILFLADDALSGSLGGGFGDGYGWKGPSELEFENVSRFMADSLLANHPEEELDPVVFAISDWTHPCDTACDSLPDGQCGIWCECRNPQWELEYSCTRDTVLVRVLPVLRERLNEGGLVWNYQGHANKFFLGHEEFYRDDNIGRRDVEALRNEGKPFVFLGFACHLAEFDRYDELTREDCMAEKLMNVHQSAVEEPAGAVASFASSGYEFLTPNLGFNIHVMNAFYYPERALDPNELDGGGVGLPSGGGPGYAWTLGESTTRARLLYQGDNPGSAGNTTNNRQAAQRYILLGDPALRPDVAKPEITVTIDGEPVQNPGLPFFVNDSSYPNGAEIRFEAADSRGLTMRLVDSIQGVIPSSEYTLTTIDETTDGVVQRQRLDYFATFRSDEYDLRFEAQDANGNVSTFVVRVQRQIAFEFIEGPYVYPSPFTDRMNLVFTLKTPAVSGRLEIYTISGRKVRTVDVGSLSANRQVDIPWDGRDDNGLPVSNGTYLLRYVLEDGDGSLSDAIPVSRMR